MRAPGDRDASASAEQGKPHTDRSSRETEGGTANRHGKPDAGGREVRRERGAASGEGGEGADARPQLPATGNIDRALPEAARGRFLEIYQGDHARGCGGVGIGRQRPGQEAGNRRLQI